VPAANRLAIDAILTDRGELRYTPAGVPALECTLWHASEQQEAGGARKVACELHAVAFGDIARELDRHRAGAELRCQGFLARRYRTGQAVALHLTQIVELKGASHASHDGKG